MPRTSARVAAVLAASLLAATAAAGPAGAADGDPAERGNTGIIEIPYGEPAQIRPTEGWSIECASLGGIDGVAIACAPDELVLTAEFDPAWGERLLRVPLRAGPAAVDVAYRLRLGPPPVPEIGADAVRIPLEAGRQTLVPLALLDIACTLCRDGARISADAPEAPEGTRIGVSPTHLAVRAATPGVLTVTVTLTDDAGQETAADVRLFVTAPGEAPTALHIAAPPGEIDLAAFTSGDGVRVSCLTVAPGAGCTADGVLRADPADGPPRQVAFRAVDAVGRQSVGSVTIEPDGTVRPAIVEWATQAPLGVFVPPPPADDDDRPSPLAAFARILQEVPPT